ncbi:hypothetical protein BU26DRAFT_334460 [Trematosphaeria pertusa]|uniref:Uncharacterized protein n=1 Tax=Trematosphaeria pertusa TaxID=390896 RepID=A0A6A6ID00_9PLEO|nr:uncharacterized protein BU26DRAFT_334460 [Trematosphaeria pertusa]KAF2248455.1 hypothetical protein BU26DRAFT_334460 [Trematosphaeria pertusa]
MAVATSPSPIYHSPQHGRNHQRRSSTRKSFTSMAIPSSPQIESPRTLCPRDGDAFSYNPSHLPAWYIPQDLWERLPATLQSTLASMQHAGAAALTGFERLDKHTEGLDSARPPHRLEEDEFFVQMDDLPPPKMRTTSNASSVFLSDVSSPASPNSESASPSLSASQVTSPVSPICLTPSELQYPDNRARSRERSFSIPLEPHDAYYATELSHLRTEALPRLRHAARKVDTEWYEAKRSTTLSISDINDFENWWAEKKCRILHLNEQGKRLSLAIGLSSSGMGWTAP